MRRIAVPLAALLLLSALSGCFAPIAVPEPTAQFEITDWIQPYYTFLEQYGLVEIAYKVTNSGTVGIDYYEVWFEVTCADGSKYQDWTNGLNLPTGTYLTDATYIDTMEKKAVSVRVSRYELTTH